MELYLITGFLGAGKTTFLKNFARQFAGRRLLLLCAKNEKSLHEK